MFAEDQLPTYKAGGKNAEVLIEEMRLRFEWALLDGQARRASQQQLARQQGWDKLTWDERKRLGILKQQGLYSYTDDLVEEGPVSSASVLDWTPAGPATAEQAAAMKPKPKARKRKANPETNPQVQKASKNTNEKRARVAELRRQIEVNSCNG